MLLLPEHPVQSTISLSATYHNSRKAIPNAYAVTESGKIVQARAQHDSIASFVFTRANIGIRYQRYKTGAHAPLIFQTMARSPWGIPVVNRVVEGTEMQVHASTKSSETAANESSLLCTASIRVDICIIEKKDSFRLDRWNFVDSNRLLRFCNMNQRYSDIIGTIVKNNINELFTFRRKTSIVKGEMKFLRERK